MKLLLISLALALSSCAAMPDAIREKTWPLEMAVFGTVEPWGDYSRTHETIKKGEQ